MAGRFKKIFIDFKRLILTALIVLAGTPAVPAEEAAMPFRSGEKLIFDVTWGES